MIKKIILVLFVWAIVIFLAVRWWFAIRREERRFLEMYDKEEKDEGTKTL